MVHFTATCSITNVSTSTSSNMDIDFYAHDYNSAMVIAASKILALYNGSEKYYVTSITLGVIISG